jgi:ethanolamine transporter
MSPFLIRLQNRPGLGNFESTFPPGEGFAATPLNNHLHDNGDAMNIHEILMWLFAAFAILGALDRIIGNRFGLGERFEEGILAMGSLALAMVGIICLAPVLADLLKPVVVPVYRFLGADPAMFAGTILACDMGGGALALEMTADADAAALGGVITGSMLGATLVFTIPVAMGILKPEDRPALAKGVLCGLVTIPVGILVGGLVAGFEIGMVLRNLIPIVMIAALIAIGLWKAEKWMIRGFVWFGKGVTVLITLGLVAAILEKLTGFAVIPRMAPIENGFMTVGEIAIILAGAFPLVYLLTKLLQRPLSKVGTLLKINETAASGLVASLANSIATFGMVERMDRRGKVVNIAFAVSAAFVFGDHLGFTAGFAPELLPAVIAGKLSGGISAIAVALWLTKKDAE